MRELKKKVAEITNEDDYNKMRIVIGTKEYANSDNDSKTLHELDIDNDATINIVFRLKGGSDKVSIKVKMYDGREILIQVAKDIKIRQLKKMIAQ